MSFIARFAIAPGSFLTIAQARLALANRDLARAAGGAFALRFDDLGLGDDARAREKIGQDLRWLGIAWDAEFRQSERSDIYRTAIARLQAAHRLYPCFENDDELRAKRERRVRMGKSPVYDRAMLKLTSAQRAAAEANGKQPHWRFRLSDGEITWKEAGGERPQIKLRSLSDPVLLRADGGVHPTLASAIDDSDMGISLLACGADAVTNSAVQYDIRAALGENPGRIALSHLPALIDATQGTPLGKRARALEKRTIRPLQHDGIEASALVAYLHDLRTVPRFDSAALLTLNRHVLAALPFAAVQDRLAAGADAEFWHAVRGHIDLLPEARIWWNVVAGEIVPPILERAEDFLAAAHEKMPSGNWDNGTWPAWLAALGLPADHPCAALLRLALTGEADGPPMDRILPLMTRARAAARLRVLSRAE